MKHFIVIYMKKGNRPSPDSVMSRQLIEAMSQEDIYGTLYERLHITEEEFNARYEIAEIREV